MQITHPFNPIIDNNSTILILGSFPSVKSREDNFYYAHLQNRFWKVLSKILKCNIPLNKEEKINMLLANHIAIWDVVKSCEIEVSSDASIKNVVINDILDLIKDSKINKILFNGNKSYEIFKKYSKLEDYEKKNINLYILPSTSPANARYSFDKLYKEWKNRII